MSIRAPLSLGILTFDQYETTSQTLPGTFIDAIKRETRVYFDNENKLTGQLTCQKFNQTWRHTKKGVLAKY
ncbi:hypothetical protein VIBR0546_13720 [Vibrio brasiliensis LMG 20546]|jgi:hypothetical protein|uniref:Uncharacterized protein n=1 Tax=Vibrio brasiliensis LMG 20546 TaxID=945543 RepID=E8LUW3_9VIBR|nr:hypothetical protein VIBR0546_13720 [Vibrio brasiliensis LMG 20546]